MLDDIEAEIRAIIEPYVEKQNLELFELMVRQYHSTVMIEILVDHIHGGVMVDECSRINRYLTEYFEEEGILEDYTLDVSSPGVDRPLTIEKDFLRVQGRDVRVHLFDFVEGKKEHLGNVKEVQQDRVVIESKDKVITITFENISKAVQII